MKSEILERFIETAKLNGIEVLEMRDGEDLFKKVSYNGESHFKFNKIGVVKAISGNAQEGNVLVDVSDDFKLSCVVDVDELYVILERDRICSSSFEAYKKANGGDYLLFVGAESKTADIEKQLISGVQGAKRVVFIFA